MTARAALALTCALAAAIGVAATWPLVLDLGDRAPASVFTEGHIAALSVATRVPPWLTHTDLAGWPDGVDFRPLLWPSILLAHLVGGLAAYDLTVVFAPVVNVLGGWLLGRVLFGEDRAAIALGALLAFPPWVRTTLQNGQPEQAVLGLGAALVALTMWASAGSRHRLGAVAPAVALAGISAPHVVLATLAIVGVWAAAGARDAPRRMVVLALAAAGAVLVAAYHAPGFDRDIQHFFSPFGLLDAQNGPAPKRAVLLADLFWAARAPPGRGPGVVHLGYLGIPLVLGALAALPSVTPRRERWAIAAAILLLALAFGESGPFGFIVSVSSTLAASGTPYRFVLGAVLALSILVARTRWAPVVVLLSLVEAVWVDPRPLPFPLVEVETDPSSVVLRGGSGPVLDLPLVGRACREGAGHYLAEAGRHGRPTPLLLRSGDLAWGDKLGAQRVLTAALASPDCATLLPPLLGEYGAIVAHAHVACRLQERERACLTAAFGPPSSSGETSWWTLPPRTGR